MDTSIQFNKPIDDSLIQTAKKVGFLISQTNLQLICYTNKMMIKWFGRNITEFSRLNLLSSNFVILHRSFMTALIMKSWVTCAVDDYCITPPFSRTNFCCGCHRYDASAISIINAFYFLHPSKKFKEASNAIYTIPARYKSIFNVSHGQKRNYFL